MENYAESIAGKSIITQIKKRDHQYLNLKKEKDIFDKEKTDCTKNVLSKDEFESKIKDLRNEISNYQKERNKASNNIAKLRIKASTKLISNLTPILEEYSKKNSIRIIIQKKQIVMGTKEDDITKDILELVNQKIKNIKLD